MSDSTKSECKKEISYPTWIDVPLITKALRSGGEENAEVTSIAVRSATSAGDNYISALYRVTATITGGGTRSLLVKGPVPGGTISDYALESGIFERESLMLTEVVPKIEELLEEVAPGRWGPLAARCPLHGFKPEPFLVLEDLAPLGFRLAEKRRGQGLRHCLISLRALARFHAGSYALLKRNLDLEKKLSNNWRCKNEGLETHVKVYLQATANACKKWPGFEDYGHLIEKLKDTMMERIIELNDPKPGAFNVITHGDFWLCNMMFRYDADGFPCEHRMVDFQLCHVASPAIDVLYFLSGSTSADVSTHHQDLLVREYYIALQEAMTLLGLQAPSFEELLEAMNAHGSFSLFFALGGIPVIRSDKPVDLNACFKGDSSPFDHLYDNPEVKKWMQRILPEYRRKGWLPQ